MLSTTVGRPALRPPSEKMASMDIFSAFMNDFDPSRFKIVSAGWGQPALPYSCVNYNLAYFLRCRKQRSFFIGKLLVDDGFQKTVQGLTDGSALNAQ